MVYTYVYSHENEYVTYLTHWFPLRATCYRIPNLATAQIDTFPWIKSYKENIKLDNLILQGVTVFDQ